VLFSIINIIVILHYKLSWSNFAMFGKWDWEIVSHPAKGNIVS
jgi:hypothetical protein